MSESRFVPLVSKLTTQAISPDGNKINLYAVHAIHPTRSWLHAVQIRTQEALDELKSIETFNDFVQSHNRLGYLSFEIQSEYLSILITDNETEHSDRHYQHIGTAIHEYDLRCQLQFKQMEAMLTPERNSLYFHRVCGWMPGTFRDSERTKRESKDELDEILSIKKAKAQASGSKIIDTTDIVQDFQCMYRPREMLVLRMRELQITSLDKAIIPLEGYEIPVWFYEKLSCEPTTVKKKKKTSTATIIPTQPDEKNQSESLKGSFDSGYPFFSSSGTDTMHAATGNPLLEKIPACLIKVNHEYKHGQHIFLSFELANPTMEELNDFYLAIGSDSCTSEQKGANQFITIKPQYIPEVLNQLGITYDSKKEDDPIKNAVQKYASDRLLKDEWGWEIPGIGFSKSTKLAACLLYLSGKHKQSPDPKIGKALEDGKLAEYISQASSRSKRAP